MSNSPLAPRFALHRAAFLEALGDDAALIFAAPIRRRNGDADYRYRQASDLLYLTGWTEPNAAALFRPGADQPFIMFVQARDPEREVWDGFRPGPDGACATYGADAAFAWDELAGRLPDLLQGYRTLHYRFADDFDRDRLLVGAIAKGRRAARRNGLDTPDAFVDPARALHRLRLIKSDAEIALLRTASEITGEAHVAAMRATHPGVFEYVLEAATDGTFRRRGGAGPGYTTIVGGGANATVLHYIDNAAPLRAGDLVCVDAGCEFDGYTADVTRTWPVDGTFTPPQRELYGVVLDAQLLALAACRVGHSWQDVHDVATRSLTAGLMRLGFLDGDPADDDAVSAQIEAGGQKKWFMHGTSHWLGMDVHDVGPYAGGGEAQALEPGMVLTVEPGLYVRPDDQTAPARFRGMGIRIEDDVLITIGEPDVLTAGIPKTIDEIEAVMADRRS